MEGPFYYYQAPPLQNSKLVRQMDAKIRSGIEFPSLGKITNGQLIVKDEPLTRQLFQKILEGKEDECSLEWRNFEWLSWNDQLQYFVMSQELTQEELQLRWQVCVDILTILRTSLLSSECDAQVFGSLFIGLAGPHSGIDICIDPQGDNCKALEQVTEEKSQVIINDIRRKITKALLKSRSPHLSGYFVSKLELVRMNMSWALMGFQLNHFNLNVNLSVGNRLLVQTSRLLKFYLNYDPRVRHLIIFLRYWTKFHGLSGTDKLNPYAISLLVIVYLANKKIVPSIIQLQSLADPDMIQGWDASFCEDLELINKNFKPSGYRLSKEMYSENEGQNFLNLLAGFFKMISKTDFASVVVSPQLGKIVPRMGMDRVGLTMISKLRYTPLTEWRWDQWEVNRTEKFCSALSIQDPFNLDMNVTEMCEQKTLDKFVDASKATLKILEGGTLSLLDLFVRDKKNLGERHVPRARVVGVQHLKITSVTRVVITKDTPYRNTSRKKNSQSQKPEAHVTSSQVKATPKVKLDVAQKVTVPQNSKAKQKIAKASSTVPAKSTEAPSNVTPTSGSSKATSIPLKKEELREMNFVQLRSFPILYSSGVQIATANEITPKDEPKPKSNILNPTKTKSESEITLLFPRILQEGLFSIDMDTDGFRMMSIIDQLSHFTQSLGLSQEDIETRCRACADIVFTLSRTEFPECDANLFGSLFCSLADSHSNVNLSFDPYGDNYKTLEALNPKENSKVCEDLRNKVAKVLKQNNSFKVVGGTWKLTKHRKIALLQIKRQDWDFTVELSIGNWASVQTSRLLRFYLDYDPRVKHLIQFLRYWTKFHGLVDKEKLNPLVVDLVAVVYLTKEKILPSVILLQTLAEMHGTNSESTVKLPAFGTSFCVDLELIQEHFKPSPVHPSNEMYTKNQGKYFLDLLSGFFEMISGTEFGSVIFCPLFGSVLPKKIKDASARLSDILEKLPQTPLTEWKKAQWISGRDKLYFSALTIQDPFIMDVNVGKNWDKDHLKKFVEASEKTRYCQEAPPPALERSLLACQMDPELRSGIKFTSSCNLFQNVQPVVKNNSKTALLFQQLLHEMKGDVFMRRFRKLPLNNQFSRFIQSQMSSTEKFIRIRWQVCVKTLSILRKSFPRCDACVFGSLANGLADEHSNIDLLFDPHGDNYKAIETLSFEQADGLRLQVAETLEKYEGESTYLQQTFSSFQYKTWKLTRGVLRKVTVLQIKFAKLGFTLDLCIGNRLFVRNTKLLHFYLNYDSRVKHLILFLRYWAKFHGLIGNDMLKQYVINLLALVYLTKEKIVPSVILLQTLADLQRTLVGIQGMSSQAKFGVPEMIQGYDYDASFCEDLQLIQKYFKPSTVHPSKEMYAENQGEYFLDLLSGFLEMITGTEFSSEMFCPLFGTILPREATRASGMANDILDKVPQTRLTDWRRSQWHGERNKFFTTLTIQDPFQLDVNVGRHCSHETLKKFRETSAKTLKILRGGSKSLLDIFGFCPAATATVVAPPKPTPALTVPPKAILTTKSKSKPQVTPTTSTPKATPTTSLPKATPTTLPPKATSIPTPPPFNIAKIPSDNSTFSPESSPFRLLFQTLHQTKQVPEKSLSANQFQNLPWNDQLLKFYKCQELALPELQLRMQDIDIILTILKSILPNCNAAIFGSLLTGLADTSSDTDISIDPYGDNCKTLESYSQKERSQIILKFRQEIAEILKQARSPYHLGAFVCHMELLGKTVPLVRFKLSHNNVWVDLSIGNRMSVQNSKLILFYLNYDPRVKDMILFLRYWAKFHELSGSLKIKQYAISLLVLVYLTQEKIIPSVVLLQTLADIQRMSQEYSKTNLDWDSSFCSDLDLIHDYFKPSNEHPSQQEYSSNRAKWFLELLKGFFETVKKTDFLNVVVCPLFGKIVYKSKIYTMAIKSLEQLPQTQLTKWRKKQWQVQPGWRKRFDQALTIQDPFKLDFNVAKICSKKTLDRFVRMSMDTLKILKGGPGSLLDLFVELPRFEKAKKGTAEEVTPNSSQVTQVPTKHAQATPLPTKPEATLVPSKASQSTQVLPDARSSSMSPQPQVVPVVPQTAAPTSPKPSTSIHQEPALAVAPTKALSTSQIPTQDHSNAILTASLHEAHQLAQEILTELGGHSIASSNSLSARKIEFQMERSFVTKYVTYLYNHGIIKLGHPFLKQQLKWQLTTVWRNLAIDFLDGFFESELNLKVKYVTTADVTTSELLISAVSQEAWEESLLDNEMFSQLQLKQNKNPFHSKESTEKTGTKLMENMKNLALPPQKILYKGISVQVDYPFWEKIEKETKSKKTSPFEIHVLVRLKAWMNKWNECVPPTIAFVIQNGNPERNQELAFNGLIAALKDQFPAYLEYQLEQWLEDGGDWGEKLSNGKITNSKSNLVLDDPAIVEVYNFLILYSLVVLFYCSKYLS